MTEHDEDGFANMSLTEFPGYLRKQSLDQVKNLAGLARLTYSRKKKGQLIQMASVNFGAVYQLTVDANNCVLWCIVCLS